LRGREDLPLGNTKTASGNHDIAGARRVFSIPPGAPFLETLAHALVHGELVSGFRPIDEPACLVDAIVYLPTRRAARIFGDCLVKALGKRAALLPDIRALGDSDEELLAYGIDETDAPAFDQTVNPVERLLFLANLVKRWSQSISSESRELFEEEAIAFPSSSAEAIHMAAGLADLLDQMFTEEIDWHGLNMLANQENGISASRAQWAQWWNLTLEFLAIVSNNWPAHLVETKKIDLTQRRGRLLDLQSEKFLSQGSAGPVIAAGSTGSIPATARLLRVIASLPNGAVVLPGLDRNLDEDFFTNLAARGGADSSLALHTHPQYGLSRLTDAIGVSASDVVEIRAASPEIATRNRIISKALLPAAETAQWASFGSMDAAAFGNVAIIEAQNEREEALALAIAMREVLETPGKTAALTTPNRSLARRVASELKRFDINIDDSAGIPLTATPIFTFVRLLCDTILGANEPAALAALIKHPIITHHLAKDDSAGRLLEIAILRDAIVVPRPGELADAVRQVESKISGLRFAPDAIKHLTPHCWQALQAFCQTLDTVCQPLCALGRTGGKVSIKEAAGGLYSVLTRISEPANNDNRASAELFRLLELLSADQTTDFIISSGNLADVMATLADSITVREIGSTHPRLHIWGPLEARLQTVDTMLLGGLNEAAWPSHGRNDPFLNRAMKTALGLSLPERRIGQAAHDFQQLSAMGELIYSRSLRVGKAPAIASRWLQRLGTLAGETNLQNMRRAGQKYIALAHEIDSTDSIPGEIERPNPKPPVDLRPKSLSVTEIEQWIRDPYAIYARHLLHLQPLPPLVRTADPMLKGSLYHRILERFVMEPVADSAIAHMKKIAEDEFENFGIAPEIAIAWRPRFMEIAHDFIEWEAMRTKDIVRSHCEIRGRIEIGTTGFILRGRADRIDVYRDGTIAILDYKTGTNPTKNQARTLSPQLALEGMMAKLGAFEPVAPATRLADLAYVRLRQGNFLAVDHLGEGRNAPDVETLAQTMWQRLGEMVLAYQNPEQGYISRYAPFRESDVSGDYDHLARVREWMVAEALSGTVND
jgi:ATP-dependent helicase/nuclease subunit B